MLCFFGQYIYIWLISPNQQFRGSTPQRCYRYRWIHCWISKTRSIRYGIQLIANRIVETKICRKRNHTKQGKLALKYQAVPGGIGRDTPSYGAGAAVRRACGETIGSANGEEIHKREEKELNLLNILMTSMLSLARTREEKTPTRVSTEASSGRECI